MRKKLTFVASMALGLAFAIPLLAAADTTPPFMPTNLTHATPSSDVTATFTWNVASDDVGVTAYDVQIDGGSFASVGNVTTYTTAALANGSHTFGVRARDAAGNASGTASLSFTIVTAVSPTTFSLEQMAIDAGLVVSASARAELEASTGKTCEWSQSTASAKVSATLGSITNAEVRADIENFAACGTLSTWHLGAGERLGIVNSYKAAFAQIPSTSAHWNDVIKIGNGRFPAETSASAEASAKTRFSQIYLRSANMDVESDRNAVVVMAYGLRPLPRNLSAEASAVVTFRAVYGRTPASATDWDAVRATAYSGATR